MYLLYFILYIYKAIILFKHCNIFPQAISMFYVKTVTQQKRSYPEIRNYSDLGFLNLNS